MTVSITGAVAAVSVDSPAASVSLLKQYGDVSASLEVSVRTSAIMRAIDPAQAASESPTAIRTPVEVQIWDPVNSRMLAVADGRMDMQWLDDLNDAGSGSFALHRYDPKAAPENMAIFNLVKYVYGGRVRFVSRIERRTIVVVGGGDHQAQVWKISGRGALSLLSDAVLYPEYGINEFTRKQRSFFFGSKEGSWYVPSEWFPPRGLPLAAVPADHPWKGSPQGWVDPDAQWIWPTDPNKVSVAGPAWFRSTFTLTEPTTITVYATADDQVTLYVDGYPALAMGGANEDKAFTKGPAQFSIKMGAGPHLIAAEVLNHDESLEEVQPIITANEVVPAHATNSNLPYVGKGFSDGGNPYVNGNGSVDGGGTGDAAFDGDPNSFWMSVGNYLGWSSAYEYVEGTFAPQLVTAVRVHVRGGPYTAYISLKDGGNGWNGDATVPYTRRVVNTGANIRYVRAVRIENEQDATINIPPQMADRVRITLRADWDSGVWQYRWRACVRTVRVTSETRTGSYIRGGNFAGLLVSVVTQDDKGVVTGVLHRSQAEGWLCKTGERPGWMPAHILTRIIEEARDRSVLGIGALKLGFTDVADSYGMPWTTPRKDVAYGTGTGYLELVKKLSEDSEVDIWMDVESLTLNAAEQRGEDRTTDPGTLVLRPGQSLTDFSIDSGRPQSTRLVVESSQGWLERGDFAAELTYGRVEGFVSLGSALSVEEAGKSADNELQRFASETWDSTTSTTGIIGPRPYLDYGIGDYVMLPTGFGSDLGINRVLSLRISEGDSGSLEAIVELDRTLTVPERTGAAAPPVPQPPVPGEPPGGGEVGVPSGTVLKVLTVEGKPNTGDVLTSTQYKVRTPGAVFDGWEFDRNVLVEVPGVVFTNCRFSGIDGNPANTGLVAVSNDRSLGVASFTATRCSMIPRYPNDGIDGVRGSNFTLDACEITRTVDGMQQFGDLSTRHDPYAGNVLVQNCWIHDLIHYDNNSHPGTGDPGTHNDGVQIGGGDNIRFINNIFSGTMRNAGMFISQARQDISVLIIEGNTFGAGSAAAINLYDNAGSGPVTGLRIASNIFDAATTGYTMLVSKRTLQDGAPYIQGNVWSDGRQPPPKVNSGSPPPALELTPGWRSSLVLNEEWTSLNTAKWDVEHSDYGANGNRVQYYRPENIVISAATSGGVGNSLKMYAKREAYMGKDFTAGMLSTRDKGVYYPRYGRYAFRARIPHGHGIWPAFWLRHHDGSSICEPDIFEYFIGQNPGKATCALHRTDNDGVYHSNVLNGKAVLEAPTTIDLNRGWHTFYMDIRPWTAATISGGVLGDVMQPSTNVRFTVYVDNRLMMDKIDTSAMNWSSRYDADAFDITLQGSQLGGEWVGHPDDPLSYSRWLDDCLAGGTKPNSCTTTVDGMTNIRGVFPNYVEVDWVRVWRMIP